MNSSRLVIWVAPSSISILPKNLCSNSTRCWCSVCISYRTRSTSKLMRKPRSSNRVSGIQRFSDIRHPDDRSQRTDEAVLRPLSSVLLSSGLSAAPAQELVNLDPVGLEGLAQDRDAGVRVGA